MKNRWVETGIKRGDNPDGIPLGDLRQTYADDVLETVMPTVQELAVELLRLGLSPKDVLVLVVPLSADELKTHGLTRMPPVTEGGGWHFKVCLAPIDEVLKMRSQIVKAAQKIEEWRGEKKILMLMSCPLVSVLMSAPVQATGEILFEMVPENEV